MENWADTVTVTDDFVLFVRGPLSQWWGGVKPSWETQFSVDAVDYNCCEQYMMAQKARMFGDASTLNEIMTSLSPKDQKALGRRVQNFNAATWDAVCRDVVFRANIAKFTQNPPLKEFILSFGTRRFVEAAHYDRIWGIGLRQTDPRAANEAEWLGTNYLGICLTEVRDCLRHG